MMNGSVRSAMAHCLCVRKTFSCFYLHLRCDVSIYQLLLDHVIPLIQTGTLVDLAWREWHAD